MSITAATDATIGCAAGRARACGSRSLKLPATKSVNTPSATAITTHEIRRRARRLPEERFLDESIAAVSPGGTPFFCSACLTLDKRSDIWLMHTIVLKKHDNVHGRVPPLRQTGTAGLERSAAAWAWAQNTPGNNKRAALLAALLSILPLKTFQKTGVICRPVSSGTRPRPLPRQPRAFAPACLWRTACTSCQLPGVPLQ